LHCSGGDSEADYAGILVVIFSILRLFFSLICKRPVNYTQCARSGSIRSYTERGNERRKNPHNLLLFGHFQFSARFEVKVSPLMARQLQSGGSSDGVMARFMRNDTKQRRGSDHGIGR
jgi:hypothetical protein